MKKCPLCGSKASYVGLFSADCASPLCTNYKEPARPEYGTFEWAVLNQARGLLLECATGSRYGRTHWSLVPQDFALATLPAGQITGLRFRIVQVEYAAKCPYEPEELEWARAQNKAGLSTRRDEDGLWVVCPYEDRQELPAD